MNNNNAFAGKVALVTGGTSGIGKATAIEFARAGGGDAAFVRADVAKEYNGCLSLNPITTSESYDFRDCRSGAK